MIDFSPVCVFGSEHIALALVALVGTTRHGWLRERKSTVGSINMQDRRVAFDPVCVFGPENACVLTLVALVALVGWLRERERVSTVGALTCRRDAAQNSHWQRIVSSIRSLLTTFLQCILEALGSAYQHSLLHPFTADYSPHLLIC